MRFAICDSIDYEFVGSDNFYNKSVGGDRRKKIPFLIHYECTRTPVFHFLNM